MDRKIFVNYFYNTLYQVIAVLAPLIITPYTTRVIGETGLGINAFTGTIVQWFVIFGIMGIHNYGIRTIGTVRDDKEVLSKTFFEIFTMQVCNLLLMTVLYILLISVSSLEYKTIYLIQGISLLTTMTDISWFFLGIEEFKIASIRNILVKIAGIICIFLFIKKPEDLTLFITLNLSTAFIGQLLMFTQVSKYITWTKVSIKDSFKNHFKENFILFIPQIATSVYSVLDQTLVGLLATDWEAQSAFYQQAIRFVKMLLYFITSIGSVMLPRIANTHQKGDHKQIMAYLTVTCNLALYLAIPLMFGIASVSPHFIPWFLPEPFRIVSTLIIITSPIILFISLSNVFGLQYLLPVGEMKKYSTSVVTGAVVNLVCNLLLIPKYGALGACIAIVCAELSVTLTQWVFVKDKLKLDIKVKNIILYFISGIIMAAAVTIIGTVLPKNIVTNIIQVLAGFSVYMGLLTVLKEDFHTSILNKILSLLHTKDKV